MKCPKCNYVSHDYLDTCRKCSMNLAVFKQQIGLFVLQPGTLNLSAVLGNRSGGESFDGADTRAGVDDFDISLDDYSDRPVIRRVPGTFIRPDMQHDGGNLQHLTLQLDASAMSTELSRSIVQPPAESPRSPGSQAPPPLPPVNRPQDATDSSQGHLTLDLGAGDNPTNLVSGLFPQPPQGGRPRPTQPAGMDRARHPDADTTEEGNTLPPPGTSGGPRASGLLPKNVNLETDRGADRPIPLLDSTTDEVGGIQVWDATALQEEMGQPLGGTHAVVTEDAFDVVERLENPSGTMPGPGEMLPSGMIPQAGLGTTRSRQPSGDTLDELTASDPSGESLAFNLQGAATNTNDDTGLLDDENPFQFDLDEMDFDSKSSDRNQGPQHESMPGRLTLELDVGAMSLERSSASMDDPAASNMSETERRTVELRLDVGAMTDLSLANAAFTSLEDTAEFDETPKGAQSGLETPDRNANAPGVPFPGGARRPDEAERGRPGASSAPPLQGQQAPEATGEFLLDLDDLDDDPRPARS